MPLKKITKEEFRALPRSGRAVAIAKDVISLLDAEEFIVEKGVYCVSNGYEKITDSVPNGNCHVCGIGAMFASHFRINPSVIANSDSMSVDREEIVRSLRGTFSAAQLNAIEHAFEGWDRSEPNEPECLNRGAEWYRSIPWPRERLKAICCNIIRNKGRFKIEEVPE